MLVFASAICFLIYYWFLFITYKSFIATPIMLMVLMICNIYSKLLTNLYTFDLSWWCYAHLPSYFYSLLDVGFLIRLRYGNHVLKLIRKYEKHNYRLRKIHLDITFLNSCLGNDLCPTFLRYKLSSKRLQNSESYRRSQHLLLREGKTFKTIERKDH